MDIGYNIAMRKYLFLNITFLLVIIKKFVIIYNFIYICIYKMNNIFRPISLSEGVINEKKDILLRKFSKNDLTDIYIKIDEDDENISLNIRTPKSPENKFLLRDTNIMSPMYIDNENVVINSLNKYQKLNNDYINDDENINLISEISTENILNDYRYRSCYKKLVFYLRKLIPSKSIMIYLLKKLFMFMFHLTLISIFEIIFFFSIVSIYENKAIIGVIINFFKKTPTMCNNMNYYQKEYFTNIFNSIINTTKVNENSIISSVSRNLYNNKLFVDSWMYFLIIIGIDIILLLVKIYYKIKINLKKIILENIVMILILGIYEYMFFKTIILLYQNISQDELIKLIVEEFNNCLV